MSDELRTIVTLSTIVISACSIILSFYSIYVTYQARKALKYNFKKDNIMINGYVVYYTKRELNLTEVFYDFQEAKEFALDLEFDFLGIELIKNGEVVGYIKDKQKLKELSYWA